MRFQKLNINFFLMFLTVFVTEVYAHDDHVEPITEDVLLNAIMITAIIVLLFTFLVLVILYRYFPQNIKNLKSIMAIILIIVLSLGINVAFSLLK